ncbi:uncharacterized protein [Typha latifolia]|uniref:uncharacterized protein n=1 Tax=Typha latifolia TaxID=4733 RepID=UPI003C2B69B7
MKFKDGDKVEICRKNDEPFSSWFPATILSLNKYRYTVRYELFLTTEGEPMVEKVYKEDVRPHPPPDNKKRWILGEVAEVFDLHSWRIGKIAKILKNSYFVVRLFGSIQLREFHISRLRVRQAWHNNRWVAIEKVSEQKKPEIEERCEKNHPVLSTRVKDNSKNLKSSHSLSPDDVDRSALKKRKTTSNADIFHELSKRALLAKGDAVSFSKNIFSENYLHRSNEDRIYKLSEIHVDKRNTNNKLVMEENECSVASCSGNDLEEYTHQDRRKCVVFPDCFPDDAMSSCPFKSEKKYQGLSKDELAANVHQLELQAYQSTVQAFFASGPLTWEQESLLTNLRLSLNITNEEHLHQLRHLLSA